MNKKEILSLIKTGEGHNLEFKESFSSEIYKEICSFANANGGRILLGVTDKNKIKCIEITNRLKSQIHDLVRNFDPKIEVSIKEVDRILVINVPEGKNKPYSVNGRFYLRQGTNSQQLSRDEIRDFFQKEGKITFDEKIDAKFDFKNDFNESAFKLFLEKAKISPVISREEILKNLELLEDGKMRNAGILLFCNKVTRFFLNATILCSHFQGNDKYKILDSQEFEENFYSNYQKALDYIKSKINTEYIIRTAGPREEVLELPEDALKEALLNAMAHRSYFVNGYIHVNIFNDRIEITNPGGLVPGLAIKDLGSKSKPRNHLLFGLMQRMDLVEKAGSGIARIKLAMKEYKLEPPIIEADENWFTIIFKRPDLQKESYEDRIYGKRKKTTQKIIEVIKLNPYMSRKEIAEKIGNITEDGIKYNLAKLVKEGKIKRIGPDKGGSWEVLEQNVRHKPKIKNK